MQHVIKVQGLKPGATALARPAARTSDTGRGATGTGTAGHAAGGETSPARPPAVAGGRPSDGRHDVAEAETKFLLLRGVPAPVRAPSPALDPKGGTHGTQAREAAAAAQAAL